MTPYYEEDGITIYHGDCREVLGALPGAALVCTDPPYNAKKDYGTFKDNLSEEDYASFMSEILSLARGRANNQFWVAPRYKMPLFTNLMSDAHLIVIRRGASGPYRHGWSDQFETALAVGKPNWAHSDLWGDIRLKGEGYFFREVTHGHPGYTPYKIMERAIYLLSKEGDTIIEPFAGTGTTLFAAKNLGRKAIGIEIEEKYCEIAANRLRQEVFKL